MKTEPKPIDLGRLQTTFEADKKSLAAAERALKRAQDDRDAKKEKFNTSEAELKTATRAVLG